MPLYESTFIVRQDLSRQDVAKIVDAMVAIIEQGGGKVIKNEYWGLRSLAYRVEKHRKGHYVMLGVEVAAAVMKEVERNLRINESVIRNLTIRVDEMDAAPSVMMQQSRSRDDAAPQDDLPPSDEVTAA